MSIQDDDNLDKRSLGEFKKTPENSFLNDSLMNRKKA